MQNHTAMNRIKTALLFLAAACAPLAPTIADAVPKVVAVAAGDGHSLYVTADGKLWAMGSNTYGLLGDGFKSSCATPVLAGIPVELHVSPDGDDANDGLTPETAKKSLDTLLKNIDDHRPCIIKVTGDADTAFVISEFHFIRIGAALEIGDGVVLKFAEGAGFGVMGGGRLTIGDAILTHIADDTVAGDTNDDADRSVPAHDKYIITGPGIIYSSGDCEVRYNSSAGGGGGTLLRDETWQGHRVYKITSDLIIPGGRTLTIGPGAIIKFAPGTRITVNSGGALNINGASHAKVILTSIRDDARGGDTNGDGGGSVPQPGDWTGIINDGGTVEINHAGVYWSGAGQYTNQGNAALRNNSGALTVRDSELRASLHAHVRAGGTVMLENTILNDARQAVELSATLSNCVIYACQASLASGIIRNTVVAESGAPSCSFVKSIVWRSGRTGNGAGYIVADPLFRDPARGDFTLRPGSPCIDAGDGAAAPERDYFGQPRADDLHADDTGTPSGNGAVPDIGIHEMTANAVSDVDIAINSITAPASAGVGDTVQITCTVTNVGGVAAQGTMRSELTFADEHGLPRAAGGVLSADIDLAPGASATLAAGVAIPALADGAHRLRLLINHDRAIFEGANTANNFLESASAIQITHPAIPSGSTLPLAPSSVTTVRLDTAAGATTLLVRAPEGLAVYASADGIPGAGGPGARAVWCGDGTYAVTIPGGAGGGDGGGVYLTIENPSAASKTATLDTAPAALLLLGAGASVIPGAGQATFSVYGAGFTEDTALALQNGGGGGAIIPAAARLVSANELVVTVVTQNAPAGAYDIVATNKDPGTGAVLETAALPAALRVSAATPRPGALVTRFELPNGVRAGRVFVFSVTCQNTGETDLGIPLVTVTDSGRAAAVLARRRGVARRRHPVPQRRRTRRLRRHRRRTERRHAGFMLGARRSRRQRQHRRARQHRRRRDVGGAE
jgi:hypothetical protein